MNEEAAGTNLVELAAGIVAAYVSNNSVRTTELPGLIAEVHRALNGTHAVANKPEPEPLTPVGLPGLHRLPRGR